MLPLAHITTSEEAHVRNEFAHAPLLTLFGCDMYSHRVRYLLSSIWLCSASRPRPLVRNLVVGSVILVVPMFYTHDNHLTCS